MTMKIAILGFGREGKSVLKYLKKSPQFKKVDISILDQKIYKNYLKNLDSFDVIFRSPGVPYNFPEIQKAIKNGAKFSSATALFFNEAKKIGCKIIGITGTKGKGTTATLIYKILKACGKNVYLTGNIGKPTLNVLSRLKKNSIMILELSSFQLQDMKVSPEIAAVLDVFPDHMDAHKNLKEYFDAKANIAKWQKKSDKIFYFSDNKYSKWIAQKSRAKKIPVLPQNLKLFKPEDLKIPGYHNLKNAVMAASVALSLDCPKDKIIATVKNFRGNEHRLELVRKIKGITFYNDSASTNPQTAAAAIRAFKEPKILIAGGKDKKLNYSPLAKALKNSNTKLVILLGQNKKKIAKAISGQRLAVREVKTLKDAVNLGYKFTKSLIAKPYTLNLIILFSPASASFDMFKDYANRGKVFKDLVRKLK